MIHTMPTNYNAPEPTPKKHNSPRKKTILTLSRTVILLLQKNNGECLHSENGES